ncbi:MAG: hypothetical protein HKL88_01335 [Bacteroidia bacterium]|nr:hypothetical protein [Bacteroidia bacterium]
MLYKLRRRVSAEGWGGRAAPEYGYAEWCVVGNTIKLIGSFKVADELQAAQGKDGYMHPAGIRVV